VNVRFLGSHMMPTRETQRIHELAPGLTELVAARAAALTSTRSAAL
jgi:hypothetical protein